MRRHVVVVNLEQVLVLVAHGECAGGARREHVVARGDGLAHGRHVEFSLLLGLVAQSVGYECHTAALLLLQQAHAIAAGVKDLQQIFRQLREVVVGVAAVEVGHVLLVCLLLCRVLLVPLLEGLERVGREGAVLVDFQHAVHDRLHRLQSQGEIGDGCEVVGQRSDEVRVGQHAVTQRRLGRAVSVRDSLALPPTPGSRPCKWSTSGTARSCVCSCFPSVSVWILLLP